MINHHRLHFMIVEADPFIARDMSEGLMEAAPDASTAIFASPEELVATMAGLGDVQPVIITKLTIAAIEAQGIDAAAARMGALIVLRQGDDPPEQVIAHGWFSLPTPFTGENLLDLVLSLQPRMPAA